MTELPNIAPQPIESGNQPETSRPQDMVRAILHPCFIDSPENKPDGVVWPKLKQGEKTNAGEVYKKFVVNVDGRNVSLYNLLDDTEGVFKIFADSLSPEELSKIGDPTLLDFTNPEVRLKIIKGLVEQIDTQGMDAFSSAVERMGDIQPVDVLQTLQALGVSYANDIIGSNAEPQTTTLTTETTIKKSRRQIKRIDHGRLQMPSSFTRTLRTGENKKTMELSKETNDLFRTPEGSSTREFQRPVEVDLRMAVALQNILLPSSERLARIQLEEQIAAKKAERAPKETTTEEGDRLNRVLKKLVSDEDSAIEINTLTQQLEQMRQKERSAILVALNVGYEDGTPAIEPPIDPDVQRLALEIQKGMPTVLGGKTLETNSVQTMSMLELTLSSPLSDKQKQIVQTYLSEPSLHTHISAESVLKDLGLENSPQKDMIIRVLADGRSVLRAFGSLAKKQDGYSKVEDTYTRGTMLDMGLKGVEYLYRHGDIKSEIVTESVSLPPEVRTETVSPLIDAEIPDYMVDEAALPPAPPVIDEVSPDFEELLDQDRRSVENNALDSDTTPPPEAPTVTHRGKERKTEDQKETAAYYIWEKRVSGNEHMDQERAQVELSVVRQEQIDAAQFKIITAEQLSATNLPEDLVKLTAQVNFESRKRAGASEISTPAEQNADWEEAEKHLNQLKQEAIEEAQGIYQSQLAEAQQHPSQTDINEIAYGHYVRRVTGTDKTDWEEAEHLLKRKVGSRSISDLQHLGFSQREIAMFGKIRDKAEVIRRINERNSALGYPLWTDDTATRRYVAYGVREAYSLQQKEEQTQTEQVTSLVNTIILKKMGKEGFERLTQMGIEAATLISLDNNNDAISAFIQKQGWENNEQTIIFVKSVIEAAKG